MCRLFVVAVCFSVVFVGGVPEASAWRSCGSLPPLSVIYPDCGAKDCATAWTPIPGTGRILLRRNQNGYVPELTLVEVKGGKSLPFKIVTHLGVPWVQLVPASALQSKRRYELRDGKNVLIRLVGRRIRAGEKASTGAESAVELSFSPAHTAPPRLKPGPYRSRTGRASWVVVGSKAATPVAAYVTGSFLSADGTPRPVEWFAKHHATGISIADNGNGCHVPAPAPNEGAYRLTVVPWLSPGVPGKAILLEGAIR